MRLINALLLAAVVCCFFAHAEGAARPRRNELQGYWVGAVTREGKVWRVNFEITRAAAKGYGAVADFVDAGGVDRAFAVEYNAPHVRLERPQPAGAPIVFEGSVEGDKLSGKFSGLGTTADWLAARVNKRTSPKRRGRR